MVEQSVDTASAPALSSRQPEDNSRLSVFVTALSACFNVPVDQIEDALGATSADRLAAFLGGRHYAADALRRTFSLDPAMLDIEMLDHAMACPHGQRSLALFEALDRMARIMVDPREVLLMRLRDTKSCIIAAWHRAVELVAPAGYLCSEDAYDLGVGGQVYAAMAARYAKTPQEALSVAEFMALAPSLIETWPESEQGLQALTELLYELEDLIEMHQDAQFEAMILEAAE